MRTHLGDRFAITTLMRSAALGAGLALAALLVACGGGSKTTTTPTSAASTGGAAATSAAGTESPSPAPAATSGSSDTSAASAAGAAAGKALAFCGDWSKLITDTSAVSGSLQSPSSETLQTDLEQASAFMQSLADNAPSDIKPDFQTYAKFWTDFTSALAKANYDVTRIASDPALQQAMAALNDPALQTATDNIDAWITKNCGG